MFNPIAGTLRGTAALAKEIAADLRYIFGDTREQQAKVLDARIVALNERLERLKTLIKSLRAQGTPEEDATLKLLSEQAVKLREELETAKIAKYNLTLPVPVVPVHRFCRRADTSRWAAPGAVRQSPRS